MASAAVAAAPADYAAERDRAIELARDGDYSAALTSLADLRRRYPDALGLLHDETAVLAWSGDNARAMQNAAALNADAAPLYVQTAVAKAARNQRAFTTAQRWYKAALKNAPQSADARAGLVMASGEAGELAVAREILQAAPANQRDSLQLLLADAYLYELDNRWVDALTAYDRILRARPANRDALTGKIRTLRGLDLPGQALEIGAAHPGLLSPTETGRLRADELALQLREAVYRGGTGNEPYLYIDAAIAEYDAAIAASERYPSAAIRQMRIDRLVGHLERHRAATVVAEYRALLEDDPDLPAYAHVAAARAYLQQREPENARSALTAARAVEPDHPDIDPVLFYVHLDLEEHEQAQALAADILARTPIFNQLANSRVAKPNDQRVDAELRVALAQAFADETPTAQAQLESLLAQAPNNNFVRHELANVYRWRGWPERAALEYQQTLTLQPQFLPGRVGRAHTQLDLQQYAAAEQSVRALQALYPDEPRVARLARRWEVHNRQQLRVDISWGESDGAVFGNDQFDIHGWWYSKPLKNNYRVFAHTFDSSGDFDTGTINRRRAGTGVEYRRNDWFAQGEVTFGRGDSGDSGVALEVDRRLNDFWSIGGLVELNSESTPLRAYDADIESDVVGLNVGYRRDDWFAVYGGVRRRDYSDSNTVDSVFVDARWRWLTKPDYQVDATGSAFASSADEIPAPYFNPASDHELQVGLDGRWLAYRRYDQSVMHRVHAQVGSYEQKNFGSNGIWSIDYDLIFAVDDTLELRAGVRQAKRYYDGAAEDQTFYRLGLDWRF